MKPTAKLVLDSRRALKTGKYPVKIRVGFHNGGKIDYEYFSTGVSLFIQEFEKLATSKALSRINDELNDKLQQAKKIIESKPVITKQWFDYMFKGKGNYESLQGILEKLEGEARLRSGFTSADLYKTTRSSITKFKRRLLEDETLPDERCQVALAEVTPEFLFDYEKWLEAQGISYNTIGIYCRYIRAAFNYAISNGIIGQEMYPFGRRKFTPPAHVARHIALTESQKNLVMAYQSDKPDRQKAVDFYKLSFMMFGLNIKDIISLRWSNFDERLGEKIISVYRAKTFGRKRVKNKVEIPITERMQEIINKHCERSLDPNAYVFPILKTGMTERQMFDKNKAFVKFVNEQLADVSKELEIPKITTYSARHTFAYIMKINGVPRALVKEMMDHESEKTTENYDRNFELIEKAKAAKLLYS